MKLSKVDLRILMIIRKEGSPMANYKIAQRLKIAPAQTCVRLRILEKNRVLQVIEGRPKFYTFNANNRNQEFIVQTVECPQCKKIHILHHSQLTVQCTCTTKKGKQRRFFISDRRIKNKRILTKQSEKSPD